MSNRWRLLEAMAMISQAPKRDDYSQAICPRCGWVGRKRFNDPCPRCIGPQGQDGKR